MPLSSKSRRLATVVAAAVTVAIGLSGCSTSSNSSSGSKDYGDISIQLSYLKNTEFAGEYEAIERGYFKDAGFDKVTLTAGGGSVSAESSVASGKVFLGISGPLITAPAIVKGAAIKTVAAEYQKNPFDIVSLKSAPITKPSDLKGKTIAVYSASELYWDAFLKANDISAKDVKVVPYTDGVSQLASKQVDGYMGFETSYTGTVGTAKLPTTRFRLADEGLPAVSENIIASNDSIKNDKDKVEAAVGAIARGWKYAIAHKEEATKLTVNKYGKSQDYSYASQLAAMTAQNPLMVTADTKKNGLLTVTKKLQNETVKSANLAGIKITRSELFDTSAINEFYKKHPSYK